MNASTTKITSLLTTLAACLSLGLLGTGCLVVDGSGYSTGSGDVITSAPAIADITIDTGVGMSASPGEGVGVFVQYAGDGHWDVFTTCDTSASGASCNFDIVVSADPGVMISGVQGADLSAGDTLSLNSDGSFRLVTDTDFGTNGVSFDADPGATIEVDVLLDGVSQPSFVDAVSGGVLLQGVPTNPVDFTPATR